MIRFVAKETKQYTVKDVPLPIDRILRERASQLGISMNEMLLSLLKKEAGLPPYLPLHSKEILEFDRDWEVV
jgi:thermostable 8-oxoguanine DNA glycosylase